MNRKIKNIIIANDAEAFEPIISSIDNSLQRIAKIRKEHFLSSRFLFWEGDNKIVITPFLIERSIITQAESIGYKNIENWHPTKIDISLSRAIMNDRILLNNLVKIIEENPRVILSPYCFTKDFSRLIELLREKGLVFRVDQEPVKNAQWLVRYLGSKVGFRVEIQKLQVPKKDIPTPEFFICRNKEEIVEAATWFYKNKKSSVIKAFSGEGGWGILMVRAADYISEIDLRKKIISTLDKDTIWNSGPFVIEEFIFSSGDDQSSPSLEVFIDDRGPKITYVCNQIVDSSGQFIGILMGNSCLKRSIALRIKGIGETIARKYFKLGYRGFFDIDFIVSTNGTPYPIETNVRRTGGTHVFDLTKHLFGKNWLSKTTTLSVDSFHYGDTNLSVKAIMDKMSEILFPMKSVREGVVVVAVDAYHPVFSFIIFASSRSKVLQVYKKLTLIWNQDTLS